jgi:hypothetical protein
VKFPDRFLKKLATINEKILLGALQVVVGGKVPICAASLCPGADRLPDPNVGCHQRKRYGVIYSVDLPHLSNGRFSSA